jgi:hypothetical protein
MRGTDGPRTRTHGKVRGSGGSGELPSVRPARASDLTVPVPSASVAGMGAGRVPGPLGIGDGGVTVNAPGPLGLANADSQLSYEDFKRAVLERQSYAGRERGRAALGHLLIIMLPLKAAPGFSNHSNGKAVDFKTTYGGVAYVADSSQLDLPRFLGHPR